MNVNPRNETTLVNTYAGQWPRSLAYILLAILVSLGIQLIAAKFQFIKDVDQRSVMLSVGGVMVVVAVAWIRRMLKWR